MELLVVAELVHRVMLQVVHLDHFVLSWLRLGLWDITPSKTRAVIWSLRFVQAFVQTGGGDRS